MIELVTGLISEGGATAVLALGILFVARDVRGFRKDFQELRDWLLSHGRRLDRHAELIAWLYGAQGKELPPTPEDPRGD